MNYQCLEAHLPDDSQLRLPQSPHSNERSNLILFTCSTLFRNRILQRGRGPLLWSDTSSESSTSSMKSLKTTNNNILQTRKLRQNRRWALDADVHNSSFLIRGLLEKKI